MAGALPTDISHLLASVGSSAQRFEADERGWVPDGPCVVRRTSGVVLFEITYLRGVAQGPYRDYWPDERLAAEGQYAGGLQDGEWRFYNPDGTLSEVVRFAAGREIPRWEWS